LPAANPADVEFMTGMIHHHSQALIMAELASANASSAQVRVLSERINVSQNDEIALMELWLNDHGEPVPDRAAIRASLLPGAAHAHAHGEMMPGMVTPEQMAELAEARGESFDRLFLTLMIQHHEGAMEMVEALFAAEGGGADDFIYKVASDTFADQGSEIDRMQGMLANLSRGAP
jgi:uncharacterized protein (DUF305 family)